MTRISEIDAQPNSMTGRGHDPEHVAGIVGALCGSLAIFPTDTTTQPWNFVAHHPYPLSREI